MRLWSRKYVPNPSSVVTLETAVDYSHRVLSSCVCTWLFFLSRGTSRRWCWLDTRRREGLIKCNHRCRDPGERYFCHSQRVQERVDKCIPAHRLHSASASHRCCRPGGLQRARRCELVAYNNNIIEHSRVPIRETYYDVYRRRNYNYVIYVVYSI